MTETVQIRRSPIVLIRTLVAIEALGFACYLIAASFGNYGELYTKLSFSDILSYQLAKFLILSFAQLLITIYAFLNWYYEAYTIQPDLISHTWGVLFKRKQSVLLRETMSVTLSSGPLGKLLHYGSVRITNMGNQFVLILADISYPKRHLKIIAERINSERNTSSDSGHASVARPAKPDIPSLLVQTEHDQLEFKSSLRFDHHTGQVNRELEKSVMKSVSALLNARGGYLIIGVGDTPGPDGKQTIYGLTFDCQTLKRPDIDGFENHFTQVFNSMIGPEFRHYVRLFFHPTDGKHICVIDVAPGVRPAYLKTDNTEHFYVRTGNITTALKLSEIEAYVLSRWPR